MSKKLLAWLSEVVARMPESDSEYDADLAKKRHEQIVNEKLPDLERARKEVLTNDFSPNEDWWGSKVTKD